MGGDRRRKRSGEREAILAMLGPEARDLGPVVDLSLQRQDDHRERVMAERRRRFLERIDRGEIGSS